MDARLGLDGNPSTLWTVLYATGLAMVVVVVWVGLEIGLGVLGVQDPDIAGTLPTAAAVGVVFALVFVLLGRQGSR